jgi:uncharacterized protein
MWIPRGLQSHAIAHLKPGKVLILFGARRTGKTSLMQRIIQESPAHPLILNGEDFSVQRALATRSKESINQLLGKAQLLAIDEAQAIPNIGPILKHLVDTRPDVAVIATGSSSFDLGTNLGEPLTGRSHKLTLAPIAQAELALVEESHESRERLETRLIYGSYPEILTARNDAERRELLLSLVDSYLFMDILQFEGLRRADKIVRLLQLLALQVGGQVSIQELATQLGINRARVERYLDLLEQCFVITRLGGFSRNLRKEISKMARWYFVDSGVRNALLRNFSPLQLRDDVGLLWENYLLSERVKLHTIRRRAVNQWFWRTHARQEIDLVEEVDGQLSGWEFKWSPSKVKGAPSEWLKGYPKASFRVIHRENYLSFLQEPEA